MKRPLYYILTTILLLACTGRQNKAPLDNIFDETNISEGDKMIKEALENYDTKRMMELADSLQKAGAISAVTANYYYSGAATNRGMLKVAEQHLKEATADSDELREWWEIESIKGDVMKWKALRMRDDGSTYTATFEMTKVK